MDFNHFDEDGNARMVDVSGKEPSLRQAEAEAEVKLGPALLAQVLDRDIAKGDVMGVARLAGIAAVKKTPELIPLAHPLAVHHVEVGFDPETSEGILTVTCRVRARDRTGMEMEAMTGATVAALTVYDMCKGQDMGISVGPIRLVSKSGGRSGDWKRKEGGR